MAFKILIPRADKSRVDSIAETLAPYSIVYAKDTKELGVKNLDGTMSWFGTMEWANITNKPTTFAPSAHTHSIGDITNLQTALNQKLDRVWTDVIEQTTVNLTDHVVINRSGAVFKTTVGNLLGDALDKELFIIVQTLPETGIPNKIYLVPTGEIENSYEEFIWLENKWEPFGLITIDLSNYYNKQEMNLLLDGYLKTTGGELTGDLNLKYNSINRVNIIEFYKNEEEAYASIGYSNGALQIMAGDKYFSFGANGLDMDGNDILDAGSVEAVETVVDKVRTNEIWGKGGTNNDPINVKSIITFDDETLFKAGSNNFEGDIHLKDGADIVLEQASSIYMENQSDITFDGGAGYNEIKLKRNAQNNNRFDITGANEINLGSATLSNGVIDGGDL